MKREAFNHPKMLDLASRLEITTTHARGIIATLWNWAADAAYLGDVGKWSDGVIARACDWSGGASEFVAALVESGWLDRCMVNRLVIHDLEEHAPDWWKSKVRRFKKSFVTAQVSEPSQVSEANVSANVSAKDTANTHATPILCSALQTSALQTSVTPLNPPDEKTKRKPRASRETFPLEKVTFPPELDVPEAREAAAKWLEHKRLKREAYKSPETFEALLQQWSRAGPEAFIAAVQWSRAQNYQGLFSPKDSNGNHRTPGPATKHDRNVAASERVLDELFGGQ